MTVFLLTFVALVVIVGGMSIGVLLGREPIKGSCGGLGALGLGECEICGGNPAKCERETDADAAGDTGADLAYDAMADDRHSAKGDHAS